MLVSDTPLYLMPGWEKQVSTKIYPENETSSLDEIKTTILYFLLAFL